MLSWKCVGSDWSLWEVLRTQCCKKMWNYIFEDVCVHNTAWWKLIGNYYFKWHASPLWCPISFEILILEHNFQPTWNTIFNQPEAQFPTNLKHSFQPTWNTFLTNLKHDFQPTWKTQFSTNPKHIFYQPDTQFSANLKHNFQPTSNTTFNQPKHNFLPT